MPTFPGNTGSFRIYFISGVFGIAGIFCPRIQGGVAHFRAGWKLEHGCICGPFPAVAKYLHLRCAVGGGTMICILYYSFGERNATSQRGQRLMQLKGPATDVTGRTCQLRQGTQPWEPVPAIDVGATPNIRQGSRLTSGGATPEPATQPQVATTD